MRLTYIVRNINFWFARVVYERDAWDVRLDQAAKEADYRIGIVLHTARGCVWLTRRILWALMHAGHAISCFMLRQMEYDADSYEAKIAGSDTFESTAARLQVLNVASQLAYEDVRQSWASNRLPENLPLLIDHKAGVLPSDVQQKLSSAAASGKTGWFDTHPCDADRIESARRLNEPGIFRLTDPATRLFADFDRLSKAVTRHQYEKEFELKFTDQNLMSAEEIVRESEASAVADAMLRKFYGGVNITLVPLLNTGELPPLVDKQETLKQWSASRKTADMLREPAEQVSRQCVEQQNRLSDLMAAHYLVNADFRVEPQEFGLPASATSVGDQQIAVKFAIEQTKRSISEQQAQLEPFLAALHARITAALQMAQPDSTSSNDSADIQSLYRLLAALGNEIRGLHEMALKLRGFILLIQNRANHSDPDRVNRNISELARELESATAGIARRLTDFAYPFSHARGKLTVAEYARYEGTHEHHLEGVYRNSDAHVQRLSTLHYQLVGKLLQDVDEAEKALPQGS